MKNQSNLDRLMAYAGGYKTLTYLSWVLSAVSAVLALLAYNELVGRIEKIEAAIASLPEKGRAWNKEYINDEWMDTNTLARWA